MSLRHDFGASNRRGQPQNTLISQRVGVDWSRLESIASRNIHPAAQTISPRAHLDAVLAAGGDLVDHGILHHPDRNKTMQLVDAADRAHRYTTDPHTRPNRWRDVDAEIVNELTTTATPSGVAYSPPQPQTYTFQGTANSIAGHVADVLLRDGQTVWDPIVSTYIPGPRTTLADARKQGLAAVHNYYYGEEPDNFGTEVDEWGWTGQPVHDGPMTSDQVADALRDFARHEIDPDAISVHTLREDGRATTYRVDVTTTAAQLETWTARAIEWDAAREADAMPTQAVDELRSLRAASFPAGRLPTQEPAQAHPSLRDHSPHTRHTHADLDLGR